MSTNPYVSIHVHLDDETHPPAVILLQAEGQPAPFVSVQYGEVSLGLTTPAAAQALLDAAQTALHLFAQAAQ